MFVDEGSLRKSKRLLQVGEAIQRITVVEPERRPVKFIGAALGYHADHRSRIASMLGQKLVGDHADFLDDIWIIEHLVASRYARLVRILAIDHEVVAVEATAVHREVSPGSPGDVAAIELAYPRSRKSMAKYIPESAAPPELSAGREIGEPLFIKTNSYFRGGGIQ